MKNFFKLISYEIKNNIIKKWFIVSFFLFLLFIVILNYVYMNNLNFFYTTFSKGFFINFDINPVRLFIIPYCKVIYFIFALYIPFIVYKFFSFEYKSGIYDIYIVSKIDLLRIFRTKFIVILLYCLLLLFLSSFFVGFLYFFFKIEIIQIILFFFSFVLIFLYLFLLTLLLMGILRVSMVSVFFVFIIVLMDFSYLNFYNFFFTMIYGIVNIYEILVIFLILLFMYFLVKQLIINKVYWRKIFIVSLLILSIIVVSGKFLLYQLDLTESKIYTLPNYLKKNLANIKGNIDLFLFTSNENYNSRILLKEKFINFKNKIKINVINIDKYPSKSKQFKVKNYDDIILVSGQDTISFPFVNEKHFLQSLNYFVTNKKIDVLILSKYSQYREFNKYLVNRLKFSNIEISNGFLNNKQNISLIAGLKRKLTSHDVNLLLDYISYGNKLIILSNPFNSEYIKPLLSMVNMEIDTNILESDNKDMYSQDKFIVRVSGYNGFIKSKAPYYFPITSKIIHPDNLNFSDILITFDSNSKDFVPVGVTYRNNGILVYINDIDFLNENYINSGNNYRLLIDLIYFINDLSNLPIESDFVFKKNIPDNSKIYSIFFIYMIVIPLLVLGYLITLYIKRSRII